MKIFGGEMSQAQIDAGLAAMRGEFRGSKVMTALHQAGVVNCVPGMSALLAREVRLGHIERVTKGIYRSVDQGPPRSD